MDVFKHLAHIHQLEYDGKYAEEARAIERHTLNYRWRARIPTSTVPSNPAFQESARTRFKAQLHALRQKQLEISSLAENDRSDDLAQKLSMTMFEVGELYLREGSYREASNCFLGMRGAGDEETHKSVVLISHSNIVQKLWSAIHTTNMQYLASLDKIRDRDVATNLVVDDALSCWMLGEYADCASLLLSLDPSVYESGTTWVNSAQIMALMSLGSVATLSRENLQVLLGDSACYSKEVIDSFLNLNIQSFRDEVGRLCQVIDGHWFLGTTLPNIRSLLQKRLVTTYLSVYSECNLSSLLETFGFKLLEFLELARDWELPLQVDGVTNSVRWKARTNINDHGVGERFSRDALLKLWRDELS